MCIEISISTGRPCKLAKNSNYCHIHKPKINIQEKIKKCRINEINSLNNTIRKKSELISKMRSDNEQLKKDCQALFVNQNELLNQIQDLNNELESIKPDADKYNDIKRFEYIKQELSNHCDTTKLNNIINFIYNNEDICRIIFGKKNNYVKEYKRLKELRNKAAHLLN